MASTRQIQVNPQCPTVELSEIPDLVIIATSLALYFCAEAKYQKSVLQSSGTNCSELPNRLVKSYGVVNTSNNSMSGPRIGENREFDLS